MSNLNRFSALMYSDDEDDAPKKQVSKKKTTAAPAPAPRAQKKKDNNRGGRGRNNGDRRSNNNNGARPRGRGRPFNPKNDRREQRRRDGVEKGDRRRGSDRMTRQPRNGERDRRHGRDPKKAGHGGVGTLSQEAAAGEAEVRAEDNAAGDAEAAPEVEPEPVETGLSLAEYQAQARAKRERLAALTGAPKQVRTVEEVEGERIKGKDGASKPVGAKKAAIGSKKMKKNYVRADKFFSTKPREEQRGDDRRGGDRRRGGDDRRRGGDDRRRGGDDRRRGGDDRRRGGDDRRRGGDDRRGGSANININDAKDFPTLG